jgi:hypothetical protein
MFLQNLVRPVCGCLIVRFGCDARQRKEARSKSWEGCELICLTAGIPLIPNRHERRLVRGGYEPRALQVRSSHLLDQKISRPLPTINNGRNSGPEYWIGNRGKTHVLNEEFTD